jgi:hypothetical protein
LGHDSTEDEHKPREITSIRGLFLQKKYNNNKIIIIIIIIIIIMIIINDLSTLGEGISRVACGTDFTALLDEEEGRLFTFGNGEAGQLGHGEKGLCLEPAIVPLDGVKDVVGGGAHMLALTST